MAIEAKTLRVAVGQPVVVENDPSASARAHAALIRAACADLMVFPELSWTGYHLDAPDIDLQGDAVAEIVEACRATKSCALIGAPVHHHEKRYIAMLHVDGDGAAIAYLKSNLAGDEKNWFTPGPGATAIEVRGWRIGLDICRDTGIAEHIAATAALGIDLYACGVVHHRSELDEQRRRADHIASTCGAYVAMAGFAGATGGGYRDAAGHSVIVSPGQQLLAVAGALPGDYATAVLTMA